MDDPMRSVSHEHFAGRLPCGSENAVTISKNGVRHVRRLPDGQEKEFLSVGLACSECFSGKNLHRLLKPGFDYEMNVMENLLKGESAAPLSIHTSSGVTPALAQFVDALEPHLPWSKEDDHFDWCVSLQMEGASAVWAAIDMLLQVEMLSSGNRNRTMVAVGSTSYHGPPVTSFGAKSPLWRKHNQVKYPVPTAGYEIDEDELIAQFATFLDTYGDRIGVILMEPQWGSSQAALPWPKSLLKSYIGMAQSRGIKVICDEIMCGLGRHGEGTLFISKAWELNPDAVTFGKAIGAGVYPLSGAIMKRGRNVLKAHKCSVLQSHTYSGSSARALMAATEVLKEIPTWLPSISKLGEEMDHIFHYLNKVSDGMVTFQGQGLLWGGVFSREGQAKDPKFRSRITSSFKRHCEELLVIPYHVPVGGFMLSPVFDIDVGTIYEIGERLEKAIGKTKDTVGWIKLVENGPVTVEPELIDETDSTDSVIAELAAKISSVEKCQPHLHATKSCTSCSTFVCQNVRTRFLAASS